MSDKQISVENSRKLDHLIGLVEGQQDAPGMLARISLIEAVLFGRHGKDGLVTKVNFMWRAHIWVWCTLSGAIGFFAHAVLLKLKMQ